MGNILNFLNLVKQKICEFYRYKFYSFDLLGLTNRSTNESQIVKTEAEISSDRFITSQLFLFFLKSSQLSITDKHIQLKKNMSYFFYDGFYSSITNNNRFRGLLKFLPERALFYGWYILYLTEFQLQISIIIAIIIKSSMSIDLAKYVEYAIRKGISENEFFGSYVFNINKKVENRVKRLRESIKFRLRNIQDSFRDWYMKEFFDTSMLIYNVKPYDIVKEFSHKDNKEAETLVQSLNNTIPSQLTHMYRNNIDEVIYNHQKNHNKFYLGMVSVQNPIFFGEDEDSDICTEVEQHSTAGNHSEDNKVIDGIDGNDISYCFKKSQHEQAEQNLIHNIHPTTVSPFFGDGKNEVSKCFYECRGRSFYRRFGRNYDEESDGDSADRNCKSSSSSERLFKLDEEHSMLYISESKRKRKFSTDLEILDFELRKEAQLNHRDDTIRHSLEKKNDLLFQNSNFFLAENLKRQELVEPNSVIFEKSSSRKILNSPILERSSRSGILNSSTLNEAKNSSLLGN